MTRIIGLDPGLARTGWGIVEAAGSALAFVAAGVVESEAGAPLAVRLDTLYRGLAGIIRRFRPAEAAVEETVVNRNPATSLRLGQARGVVLLAAAHAGLPVAEYAARRIKRAVTGTGGADKTQVATMVRVLLPAAGPVEGDAADALAVAICHAHHRATLGRIAAALGP